MYVAGRPHRLKEPSRTVLELAADNSQFFTDAEVLQELLHRYVSLRDHPKAAAAVNEARLLMGGRIEPMLAEDVTRAAEMSNRYPGLSARDLVHAAIAIRAGATHIVSADSAFDVLTEIERLDPLRVEEWRAEVTAN
jgi:predicted nucleic acid-binding protein